MKNLRRGVVFFIFLFSVTSFALEEKSTLRCSADIDQSSPLALVLDINFSSGMVTGKMRNEWRFKDQRTLRLEWTKNLSFEIASADDVEIRTTKEESPQVKSLRFQLPELSKLLHHQVRGKISGTIIIDWYSYVETAEDETTNLKQYYEWVEWTRRSIECELR